MSETMSDDRIRYLSEYRDIVRVHIDRGFEYEKEAISYSKDAFKTLTYLCGGALVALPAAVALFKTDPSTAKVQLFIAGLSFVGALVFVVAANGCAFFVMARRAESELLQASSQATDLSLRHYPLPEIDATAKAAGSTDNRKLSWDKILHSNFWRTLGLILFWLAIALFLVGCGLGAKAILN